MKFIATVKTPTTTNNETVEAATLKGAIEAIVTGGAAAKPFPTDAVSFTISTPSTGP